MSEVSAARQYRQPKFDPGLRFPWPDAPGDGEIVAIQPGVYWLRMPLPFALDHINLWVLADGDGWTVIDTGFGRPEVSTLWCELFANALSERRPTRQIVTHFHPDHFGQAGWLHEHFGAQLWMTRQEWLLGQMLFMDNSGMTATRQSDFFLRNGLDPETSAAMRARGNLYPRVMTPPPATYRRIQDHDDIDIGGSNWRVMVGTGHAPEHACLYCETRGLLISGDMVLPGISPNVTLHGIEPEADPLADYLDSLRRLRELPDDVLVLPSHGHPFHGLANRIDWLIAHHDARLDEIEQACATPRSAAQLLDVLFDRELDAHQLGFAMGESLAHVRYLYIRGRLARTDDGSVYRYSAEQAD